MALVSIHNSVIVFGGAGGNGDGSSLSNVSVAQFKMDSWSQLGDLNQRRRGANGIIFGSEILVVGGWVGTL